MEVEELETYLLHPAVVEGMIDALAWNAQEVCRGQNRERKGSMRCCEEGRTQSTRSFTRSSST